jgi:hypothetical protein
MDFRDCLPRFPLLPGQPDRLLAELYEAQTELAIVAYYFSCWSSFPFAENTALLRRDSCAAHEALYEARDIIDRVVEEARTQVEGISLGADEKTPGE